MQILAAVKVVGSNVDFEHVEGHQDTKYPGQPLSWPATLNKRCDEIALTHLNKATSPIPSVTFLPASKVSIPVGHQTLTHHIPTQLRTFAGILGMRAHYCQHHEWENPAIFDLVDWPRFHGASLSTTFLKRLFRHQMDQLATPLLAAATSIQAEPAGTLPVRFWVWQQRLETLSSLPTSATHASMGCIPTYSLVSDGAMEVGSIAPPNFPTLDSPIDLLHADPA
jgi:hypothetical protein